MAANRIDQLSPREREVLALAGAGLSSKEIARKLDISYRTVDKYIGNAIATLGARNRLEAALLVKLDASVEIPRQSPALADIPSTAPPMPPDRSETTGWWHRLPIRRNGGPDNDLTTLQRLAWIFFGAVAVIILFSQLANGLHVAEQIALGLRR